jgi:hypothetical protein
LIQGRYDLLVEAEQTEQLWQKWEQPEMWRLAHGHISWMLASGVTSRVLDWLAPRLEKNNLIGVGKTHGLIAIEAAKTETKN